MVQPTKTFCRVLEGIGDKNKKFSCYVTRITLPSQFSSVRIRVTRSGGSSCLKRRCWTILIHLRNEFTSSMTTMSIFNLCSSEMGNKTKYLKYLTKMQSDDRIRTFSFVCETQSKRPLTSRQASPRNHPRNHLAFTVFTSTCMMPSSQLIRLTSTNRCRNMSPTMKPPHLETNPVQTY